MGWTIFFKNNFEQVFTRLSWYADEMFLQGLFKVRHILSVFLVCFRQTILCLFCLIAENIINYFPQTIYLNSKENPLIELIICISFYNVSVLQSLQMNKTAIMGEKSVFVSENKLQVQLF